MERFSYLRPASLDEPLHAASEHWHVRTGRRHHDGGS